MNYEEYKQRKLSLIKSLQTKIRERQQRKILFQEQHDERKASAMDDVIKSLQSSMQYHQDELSLARPEKQEDIDERKRIRSTYAKTIAQSVSDDNPVFFHGVKSLTSLEPILSSGRLGDVDGSSHGVVDVTGRNSIQTTLDEFVGIDDGFMKTYPFLPASCMFVIAPANEKEKNDARKGDVCSICPVYFANNPERLVAIVSTTENQEYIKKMAEKYGISPDKICTFDGFIERMQNGSEHAIGSLRETLAEIRETRQQASQQTAIQKEILDQILPTQ